MADTRPIEPIHPIQPIEPIQPTEPIEPIEPLRRAEPTDLTEPTEPTEPTEARVRRVFTGALAEVLDVDPSRVADGTTRFADLGADSMDIVEALLVVEDELGIPLLEDRTDRAMTISEVTLQVVGAVRRAATPGHARGDGAAGLDVPRSFAD